MSTSAQAKEMKALALKLLSDPDYMENNSAQVKAMVEKANKVIEAAKKSKSGEGFYTSTQKDAHDKAQKKNKAEGQGFYSDHIEEVREKTLKEIDKVSSMIDEKILAALGDDMEEPMEEHVEAPAVEVNVAPEAPAEGDAFDLDMGGVGAAMAAIEDAMNALGGKSKSKSGGKSHLFKKKSKSKSEEKSEDKSKKKKSKSDTAEASNDVDYDSLTAEIANLEAALSQAMGEEPVGEDPMVAPIGATPEVCEPAAEPVADAVAVEMITSAEELESDGPITASAVQMSLYGDSSLNPFWNITARGEPIGRVYLQDQADPAGDRAFFTSSKYAQGVSQAVEKVGLKETLVSISAKFFANRIERSDVVQKLQVEADKVIKATVAQKTASLRDELVDRMMVAQSALDKNMFKDEGNSLKDAVFMQMKKFGVQNPVPYIEAAFEQGSSEYFKTVLAKAIEFLDMEPKAFEQIKKTVANSDVIAPSTDGVDINTDIPEAQPTTLSAHLSANNMPITLMQHTPATASYADLKDSLRMGIALKKTV